MPSAEIGTDRRGAAEPPRVLVTGGCGFIGSALVRHLVGAGHAVCNVDKLTYAGDPATVAAVAGDPRYRFHATDVCDGAKVLSHMIEFEPDWVVHLAAESHVDRSIDAPAPFIATNFAGTFALLDAAFAYWRRLGAEKKERFRVLHVSSDEVY